MKIVLPKIKKNRQTFQIILFGIIMFVKAYSDAMLKNQINVGRLNDVKYYLMLFVIAYELFIVLKGRYMSKKDFSYFGNFIIWISAWGLLSLFCMLSNQEANVGGFQGWFMLVFPFVYCYFVINHATLEDIEQYFKVAFIVTFFVYLFFEIGITKLTVDNLLMISYSDSYSPFESEYSAGSAIGTCCFFCFAGKKKGYLKWQIMAVVFCLLTFKRLAVVMAIFYFVLPRVMNVRRKLSKKSMVFRGLFFISATIALNYILNNRIYYAVDSWFQNTIGIDFEQILMGRVRLYNQLISSGFESGGYGSSVIHMYNLIGKGNGIELELVQILLEVGVIGLIIFIWYFYKQTNRNFYAVLIIDYMLLNSLTSSSLRSPFAWVLVYLAIGYINKQEGDLDYDKVLSNYSGL